jgi:hypothetical protein
MRAVHAVRYELAKATVAIVSAAGVHQKDQEAFNIADDLGDLSYRVMGRGLGIVEFDGDARSLRPRGRRSGHQRRFSDRSPARLKEDGFIGGIARKHIGYMATR